ncbi:MAG: glycoside hydrolase family 3 N-terminal domain-containing protein, partial [Pseudomonadota bacterium]
ACARLAAREAVRSGVNWTFAPMIDIARDPRWGRIAESLGEDPVLASALGVAMVKGIQGESLSDPESIAACAKHFAGYGASESGRDYNTTNIPENELRNIYLPPFKAAVDAGVATLMSSFSDIDGVPATANDFLMRQVLRDEWGFDGFVVSDWDSIRQLSTHGLTADDRDAAYQAATAGVDMDMVGRAYAYHLADLVACGAIAESKVDAMASNVLRVKARLGLLERSFEQLRTLPPIDTNQTMAVLKKAAIESVVLLKNEHEALPIARDSLTKLAVIGPLADQPYEQMGTWVFDGDERLSVSPLQAIRDFAGEASVLFSPGLGSSRDRNFELIGQAVETARDADAIVLFVGEEAILSGEAHCRADIGFPGAQVDLIKQLADLDKPLTLVVMAGRPLILTDILDDVDAVLYAWHPGNMAGPAICDLLFGLEAPSGKLPVSFPRMTGQIPIYYNQKNTGRPPSPDDAIHIDDIAVGARQTSLGMKAFHLDAGYLPLFPFGFGLSYTWFHYERLHLSASILRPGETLNVSVDVTNAGGVAAAETVQLYVRDLVGSITRPVRELKAFKKVHLAPGETQTIELSLSPEDLAFYGRDRSFRTEPGGFQLWVGGDSASGLESGFEYQD